MALPVYVISLASRLDRRESVDAQLRAAGVPFQFFDAVDGRRAKPDRVDQDRARQLLGRPLYAGEIGCFLSHLEVMRRFVVSEHPAAVILEDDLAVTGDLATVLRALEAIRFDVIKLGTSTQKTRRFRRLGPITATAELVRHANVMHGTVGYAISRRAAMRFLFYSKRICYPVDVALNRSWEHGIDVKSVHPWPIGHDLSSPSSIEDLRFAGRRLGVRGFLQRNWDSLAKRGLFLASWFADRRAA